MHWTDLSTSIEILLRILCQTAQDPLHTINTTWSDLEVDVNLNALISDSEDGYIAFIKEAFTHLYHLSAEYKLCLQAVPEFNPGKGKPKWGLASEWMIKNGDTFFELVHWGRLGCLQATPPTLQTVWGKARIRDHVVMKETPQAAREDYILKLEQKKAALLKVEMKERVKAARVKAAAEQVHVQAKVIAAKKAGELAQKKIDDSLARLEKKEVKIRQNMQGELDLQQDIIADGTTEIEAIKLRIQQQADADSDMELDEEAEAKLLATAKRQLGAPPVEPPSFDVSAFAFKRPEGPEENPLTNPLAGLHFQTISTGQPVGHSGSQSVPSQTALESQKMTDILLRQNQADRESEPSIASRADEIHMYNIEYGMEEDFQKAMVAAAKA